MVLVPGQLGADDRAGPGGLSGYGGSLRLHIILGLVSDVDVAGSRLGTNASTLRRMACSSRGFLPAGAGDHHVPAGWLLARYRVTLAAHLGVHRGQLRRT